MITNEIKPTKDRQKSSRKRLKQLYEQIPETTGCMENHSTCNAWCCQKQNPQVFYVEFLNTWNYVITNWKSEQIVELVIRCVRNYFNKLPSKGCVFFNSETNLCSQHQTRPLNCRFYSQIPDEEFVPRYNQLKVIYDTIPGAELMPQCRLTKAKYKITQDDINAWFKQLNFIEEDIGVAKELHHDGDKGSYRSYSDYILMTLCTEDFLGYLTYLRDKPQEQEKGIADMRVMMAKAIEGFRKKK